MEYQKLKIKYQNYILKCKNIPQIAQIMLITKIQDTITKQYPNSNIQTVWLSVIGYWSLFVSCEPKAHQPLADFLVFGYLCLLFNF